MHSSPVALSDVASRASAREFPSALADVESTWNRVGCECEFDVLEIAIPWELANSSSGILILSIAGPSVYVCIVSNGYCKVQAVRLSNSFPRVRIRISLFVSFITIISSLLLEFEKDF